MNAYILPNTAHASDKTAANSLAKNLNSSSDTQEDNEAGMDFLSLILSKIKDKDELKNTQLILPIVEESEELLDVNENILLKEATFVQLLQLFEKFTGTKGFDKFPKFNDKLNSLLQDASILEEFKGVKSLKDILALSKKYDLGLDKITITQKDIKQLEKTFPNLAKQGFFQPKKTIISSETLLKNAQKKETQKSETSTLSKLLKEVENTKNIPNETKSILNENNNETKNAKAKPVSNVLGKMEQVRQKGSNITQESTLNIQAKTSKQSTESLSSGILTQNSEKESVVEAISIENDQDSSTHGVKNEKPFMQRNVKTLDTKQTFNSFANDFKEKLEQYKPPLMKVQLSLNPKELGQMDVTIINRGSNLHVNFASNTQAMNLFLQNQAEFKNSLVNMGFTNLEMNFSDERGQKENKRGQEGKNNQEELNEFGEFSEQENLVLDITIPNYV